MTALTTLPASADVRHGIKVWGDLGNEFGNDCTIAAYLHLQMIHHTAAASSAKRLLYDVGYRPPSDKFAVKEYRAYLTSQGQPPNQGVDPFAFLTWLKANGTINDFATIDVSSPAGGVTGEGVVVLPREDALHAAMIAWNGAIVQVVLTNRVARQGLGNGPWDLHSGETPNFNLGHAVALVAYDATFDYGVTWGHVKAMTPAFVEKCVFACWVFS